MRFLIGSHLDMSAALRRDIFDPETIRIFSEKMGTPERLKMLCLLTYADIKAVNPEALTPWKAEIGVAALHRRQQLPEPQRRPARARRQRSRKPGPACRHWLRDAGKKLKTFLEGVPTRYLRVYSADEVLRHLKMAEQLRTISRSA